MKKAILFLAAMAWVVTGSFTSTPRAARSAGNGVFEPASPILLQDDANELRIAVTPKGYDDIGSILRSMGWKFTEITLSDLTNYDLLVQFDVIFINCSSDNSTYSSELGYDGDPTVANLERFVREGGTLYASDHAYVYIEAAFPGYLQYHEDPDYPYEPSADTQTVIADIRDPGLASFMNSPTVEIQFDLPEWAPIYSVSDGVTVYLAGDYTRGDETRVNDKPLAASFAHGEGRVLYTAFHNEAQTTVEETKLLNYLVFITTSEAISAVLQESMAASGYSTQQEHLGAISPGDTSPRYIFSNPSITDLAVGLNWQEGTLRLSVFRPDGSLYDQQEGSPPVIIEIPDAEAGDWSYKVEAIDVPHENYPYVIQINVPAVVGVSPTIFLEASPTSIPDNSTVNEGSTQADRTTLYVVIALVLCLGLLFVIVSIGVVIFFVRRRKA